MPLLPSALPPKGEASRYVANDFLNLIALPTRERLCFEKSGILVSLPSPLGKGDRVAVDRVLSYIVDLRRITPLIFHTARTLSGSLCSPPSPRGEGCDTEIPLPPSNLRPFGAPPSRERRECPREPLPLEGADERSEAGVASFFGGEAAAFISDSNFSFVQSFRT